MNCAPDMRLSAKDKVEKSIYYLPLFIEGDVCVCGHICFVYIKTTKPQHQWKLAGRILRSLPVFYPPRIYASYQLLPLSVDEAGQYDAFPLAWKKENSCVMNCIWGIQAART